MPSTLIPGENYLLFLRGKLAQSFWFIPGAIMLAGVALAFVTHQLDQLLATGAFDLPGYFPGITMDSARHALAAIAGSMITVVSLVFSLTLVVLTLAAGNMGARLIETWTDNRVNQAALGLFLASFLHALLVLVAAGGENVVPVISVYVAAVGAAVNSAWLIYFIHNLSQQIRIDNTIARITEQYRGMVSAAMSALPGKIVAQNRKFPDARGRARTWAESPATGYVQTIDLGAMADFACANDCHIRVTCRPGVYVIKGARVAEIVHARDGGDDGETGTDFAAQVARAFVVGRARTGAQDFEFQIDLLVEIAVRALSPGVNDLYTAFAAIDHLSGCLAATLREGLPPRIVQDGEGDARLWTDAVTFADILDTAVKPIRQFAAGQAPAVIRLIAALHRTARFAHTGKDSKAIADHIAAITSAARETIESKTELKSVTDFTRRMGQS